MGSPILFFILAIIAIGAGIGMISSRNAIYSALFLILNMCALAVFYLILNAPFLAMVQITVYAGAIMVLFLFVIMLLGAEQIATDISMLDKWLSRILGVALLGLLGYMTTLQPMLGDAPQTAIDASPAAVGRVFFENYVFPFEVTSILLLVAMIGVVVLQVKRRRAQ